MRPRLFKFSSSDIYRDLPSHVTRPNSSILHFISYPNHVETNVHWTSPQKKKTKLSTHKRNSIFQENTETASFRIAAGSRSSRVTTTWVCRHNKGPKGKKEKRIASQEKAVADTRCNIVDKPIEKFTHVSEIAASPVSFWT